MKNFLKENNRFSKLTVRIVLAIAVGTAIFIGGFILGKKNYFGEPKDNFQPSEQRLGKGIFTNPLLECEIAEGTINTEFTNFKPMVEKYLKTQIDGQDLSYVSVYFRHLNDGLWFGINEKEEFTPASLLKVPLVIAYFKAAESDPAILSRTLRLEKKFDTKGIKQVVPPSSEIEEGKDYTVAELIERSISRSDNQAAGLLYSHVDPKFEEDLFTKFGFPEKDIKSLQIALTVKDYARFFRILFNASYLSQEYSELALGILNSVEFRDGLVAGVAEGVAVAHKFGERGDLSNGVMQFHDCGIVYYPQHPYIICLMTRGGNNEKLINTIKEISKIIYDEVDRQAK